MRGAAEQLRDLLAPLGIYRWGGTFQQGELTGEGAALDALAAELRNTRQEMNLATARDDGLEAIASLLPLPPLIQDPAALRAALAALLRIGDSGFTLTAMNDALAGCGVPAVAEETGDPLHLVVRFPEHTSAPANFERVRRIAEGILPCHLLVEYRFGDSD